MSYVPTTSQLMLRPLEYVEESSFGVFPTNPAMQWIGVGQEIDPKPNMKNIKVRNLASEDLKYETLGAQMYQLDISYNPQNSSFAKYLVNSQGGGSGSIDKSLSLLASPKINGTGEFLEILGARPDSGKISWEVGKPISIDVSLLAKSIPAYTTTDPVGTGSHASDPGTNPWIFTDPGASGITIGGTAYDIRSLSVSFKRNLQAVGVIGQGTPQYVVPTMREITFDVTIILEATAPYSALLAGTQQTIVAPLKSGTSTLTLSNAFFEQLKMKFQSDSKNVIEETYSGTAMTATLT